MILFESRQVYRASLKPNSICPSSHILYCLKYVKLLLSHGIRPILVFDGRHLPAKALTEKKRRDQRREAKARATELMRLGRHDEARQQLRRCVDITHRMALQLMQRCRSEHPTVDCIVAPYEADGQLAWLNRQRLADYVITEDSDLVLFGCSRILFKLDLCGDCVLLDAARLPQAMGCPVARYTFERFRFMCIMSGCDYLDSLPGIGLAKACKFVLLTEETDLRRSLDKIPAYLKMRKLEVTEEYRQGFLRANATFQHMIVYDPRRRRLVRLSDPLSVDETDAQYCDNAGEFFDERQAFEMALGNVDPFTLEQLDRWSPDAATAPAKGKTRSRSIWDLDGMIATAAPEPKASPKRVDDSAKHTRKFIPFRDSPKKQPPIDAEPSADLLAVYGDRSRLSASNVPPRPYHFDPLEKSPNLSRNPFGVPVKMSPTLAAITSPTKLTPTNSSLLRQCSPVKRIDFGATAAKSPLKALVDRMRRGGKDLKRTVVDAKQNVLSRFFVANQREVQQSRSAPVAVVSPTKLEEMEARFENEQQTASTFYAKSPKVEKRPPIGERTPEAKRKHTPVSAEAETASSSSQPAKRTCRSLFSGGETRDENASTDELTIDLTQAHDADNDDDDNRSSGKSTASQPTSSQARSKVKPAATCRQPGQRKSKATTVSGKTQSSLSAFGFMKKSM